MTIEDRDLKAGTLLAARFKGKMYIADVVETEDGIRYRLDGKEYRSPSSLGTAVTKKACNGWAFWSVDTSEPPEAEPSTGAASEPEEPEEQPNVVVDEEPAAPAPTGSFKRVPNQRGVDEGQVRLYCDTCRNSFIVPERKNPETCPMGHQPS